MKNDIKAVRAMPNFKLHVQLADGRVGVFDVQPHLDHPGLAALKNPMYFEKVQVLFGAPTWPEGEDVAPDAVAAGMQLMVDA